MLRVVGGREKSVDPFQTAEQEPGAESIQRRGRFEKHPKGAGRGGNGHIHQTEGGRIRRALAWRHFPGHAFPGAFEQGLEPLQQAGQGVGANPGRRRGLRRLHPEFKDDVVALPGFAQRLVVDRVVIQGKVRPGQAITFGYRPRLWLEEKRGIAALLIHRDEPLALRRFQQQSTQVEQTAPELAQPFRVSPGYHIAVSRDAGADAHPHIVAADGVPSRKDLNPVIIDQNIRKFDGFHGIT